VLTVGSLFAGIGGFDLGLERAGMRCLWQCELDPYALGVLEKHWPDVLRVPDVRDVNAETVPPVDVIAGGFPCQDVSTLGLGGGLDGERSGLWFEMFRVIRELRPRYVIVENVPALLARGLDRVLGSLASIGYDAEWDCIPASAVGAPHQRDRVWIVAYPSGQGPREEPGGAPGDEGEHAGRRPEDDHEPRGDGQGHGARAVADADRVAGPAGSAREGQQRSVPRPRALERAVRRRGCGWDAWLTEPDVGRVADGVHARTHRLAALGNAVVPQVPELIARTILEWEGIEVTPSLGQTEDL
jgi:DNA (cytosine-5)-methyltransferase 1